MQGQFKKEKAICTICCSKKLFVIVQLTAVWFESLENQSCEGRRAICLCSLSPVPDS